MSAYHLKGKLEEIQSFRPVAWSEIGEKEGERDEDREGTYVDKTIYLYNTTKCFLFVHSIAFKEIRL